MFKRLSSKAAGEGKTGGVAFSPARPELQSSSSPIGYVEDFAEPRTSLESRFNIRLMAEVAHAC
jgi:hypothetical protein